MPARRRRRSRLWAAAVLAVGLIVQVRPAAIRAHAADTGALQGLVTLGPRLTARRMSFSLYPDARAPGGAEPAPPPAPEIENVVVYLEAAPGGTAPPDAPAGPFRIEQVGLTFKPHVLAVVKGTTVEFPNRDTLFHNVFSLSKAAAFDLGRYPKDDSKSVRFDTPGVVPVFCHIHSDMSALIVVLDNPFFARPDASGRFTLDGIPPGTYTVVAWHERAHRIEKKIRIEAGRSTVVDFAIPLTGGANAE
ncbi:MAG TPA: carboxypeptidase regulatory-like domain-containing protein [Candidatus Sulfotelmatobacter sp.]|jgi:plastocyanin|nr:carboxypeptidase regulatory-like domain-containing protein [Candidatus Sulfotelmatobacter sp.]